MKAVMISIRPEWCEKIASCKKTVEVRKTKPKLITPFKCFIYCTKQKQGSGKVIGEFVCNAIVKFSFECSDWNCLPPIKVPLTEMTDRQIAEYLGNGKYGYLWDISDLVIYDTPLEIEQFDLMRPPQSWCYVEETDNAC